MFPLRLGGGGGDAETWNLDDLWEAQIRARFTHFNLFLHQDISSRKSYLNVSNT